MLHCVYIKDDILDHNVHFPSFPWIYSVYRICYAILDFLKYATKSIECVLSILCACVMTVAASFEKDVT